MPMTYYVRASQVTPDEPREGWYVSTEHGPDGPYDSRDEAREAAADRDGGDDR